MEAYPVDVVFLHTCSVVTESLPVFALKLRSGLSKPSPNHFGSLSSKLAFNEFSSVILFTVHVSLETIFSCEQSFVEEQSILSPERRHSID